MPEPQASADVITGDHAILSEDDASRDEDRVVCVIQDQYTHWLRAFAAEKRSAEETAKPVRRVLGQQTKVKYAYTDNSKEFGKASRI